MRVRFALLAPALLALGWATQAAAETGVYCADDRIEVDDRSLEQMKDARGSDVCQLGQFDYVSDADDFAEENFGGEGAACTCGD
jgi:hypothetical protein